ITQTITVTQSSTKHRTSSGETPPEESSIDGDIAAADEEYDDNSADDDEEGDDDDDDGKSSSQRTGRRRRVIPESLPRVQRIHKLDDSKIPEHLDGDAGRRFLKKIGEYIEWEPPRLTVVEEFVEMLAVDNDDATETTNQLEIFPETAPPS
ncbi:MAG: hypothetical protein ACKVII_24620, partial [Planctomycetales bacterium]